ncbi:MAG: DNA primase [Patescibacteria group bacterium]
MDQVAEIKQKLDIVDVINSYVTLKKSGRNYKAVCPFHSEKTPSFMVSQELQIYKCFGCGVAGDVFNFVEAIEGVDFSRALEILADRAGVKLVRSEQIDSQSLIKNTIYSINELTTQFYQYILLKQNAGKKALDYLTKERKLTEETIKEFRIGYAPNSWDTLYKFLNNKKIKVNDMVSAGVIIQRSSGSGYVDKFRGRVVFPLIGVDGKVVGFTGRTVFNRDPKYLNTGDSPVFHKSFFLYGLDKSRVALKKEGAVFVEGQMDLISAYQNGVNNVVCVSGTALTDSQLVILSRYTQDITFCFDSDFAGVEASYRAIEMAEKRNFNVKVAILPDEYKDIDEFLNADKEEAKKILKNAVPVYDYFLATTLKKHNKTTALGKKAITEELIPLFSRISNQVLIDHYAKKLASELGLSEDTVFSMIKKGSIKESEYEEIEESDQKMPIEKQQTEGYLISLILKSPLGIAKECLKKLKRSDFLNEELGEIFEEIYDYYEDRKSDIKIKTLVNRFDEKKGNIVTELYMWDLEGKDGFSEEILEKELNTLVDRIKKVSVKRQLKILTDEIKIAETKKDEGEIERLSKKFEKLSKGLL